MQQKDHCVTLAHSFFLDDEQFNDEKAFLIKQIQDLRPVQE